MASEANMKEFIDSLARRPGESSRAHVVRLREQALSTARDLPEDDPHRRDLFELVAALNAYLDEVVEYAVGLLVQGLQQQAAAEMSWTAMPDKDAVNAILEELAAPETRPTPAGRTLRPNVPNPHLNRPCNDDDVSLPGYNRPGDVDRAVPGDPVRQDHGHHRPGLGGEPADAGAPQQPVRQPEQQAPAPAARQGQGGGQGVGDLGHLKGRSQQQQTSRPASGAAARRPL